MLVIDNSLFHKIIKSYPVIISRVERAILMRYEYMESKDSIEQKEEEIYIESQENLRNWWRAKMCKFINSEFKWYKAYNYIMSVHLACISSMYFLHMIVIQSGKKPASYDYCKYFVDLIYLSKIYVGFHLTYIDPDSGIVVEDFRLIRERYMKSTFILDLFTCLPLKFCVTLFTKKFANRTEYLDLNRIGRFSFLFLYYLQFKKKIGTGQHLRWVFLLYLLTTLLQIITCIW